MEHGAVHPLDEGLHVRFHAQSIGVDRAAGEQERVVVPWIRMVQCLVDAEFLGRLQVLPYSLDLAGFDLSNPGACTARVSEIASSLSGQQHTRSCQSVEEGSP
jgi:hypothetical protein